MSKKIIIYSIIFILILGYFIVYLIDTKITERQLEKQALKNQEKNEQIKTCRDAGGRWVMGGSMAGDMSSEWCYIPKNY